MISSHREMAHILGLKNNPYLSSSSNEGWFKFLALSSTKKRYKAYLHDKELNFHSSSSKIFSNIHLLISKLSDGSYIGFSAKWGRLPYHAYTLHIIREGDKFHFIYVNKGERHFDKDGKEFENELSIDSVIVFTIPFDKATEFVKELKNAAKSFRSRAFISKFIHKHSAYINHAISTKMKKKNQKTSNCTIANSNIAWHLQLASNLMQDSALKNSQNPINFLKAYEKTKESYKQMRLKDRMQAFQYLMHEQTSYISKKAFQYNYLQALAKFANKNAEKYARALVESLDSKALNILINLLISNNFETNINEYIAADIKKYPTKECNYKLKINQSLDNIKKLILSHALLKLPEKTQKELISNNISLLHNASPSVQQDFLKQDFDKYSLFASAEQLKLYKVVVDFKFKNYLENCSLAVGEKKPCSTFLAFNTSKKEVNINKKIMALYSYAYNQKWDKVDKVFKDLCLTCCEQRFHLTGNKYSTNTNLALWLINKVSAGDRVGNDLKIFLKVENADELRKKIAAIIKEKNINTRYKGLFSSKMPINDKHLDSKKVQAPHNSTKPKHLT